jgi:hypothetical protein
VRIDNMARLKHIVQSTLLHRVEVEATVPGAPPLEITLRAAPVPSAASEGDRA